MLEMDAHKKTEYSKKITTRIFDRYAEVDPDSKEKVICLAGFKTLASIMKISPEESEEYFKNISDRKHQIDFDKFNSFMTGIAIPKKEKVWIIFWLILFEGLPQFCSDWW